MPRLSDTMEEGTVAAWLKKVGDKVEEGDILAEIETDKATMEFESFNEGTLLHIGIAEGDTAPVDALLAIIGDEGEDISALISGGGAAEVEEEEEPQTPEPVAPAPVAATTDKVAPTAAAIPDDVEVIKMPRLSDTMEEGTVAAWLKKVGDTVEEGDILAEIETDKATMEFESFYSGTLLYIGIQEGETSPVDAVLAVIGPAGTDVNAVLNKTAAGGTTASAVVNEANAVSETTEAIAEEVVSTPIAAQDGKRIFVSPLAKKIAEDKGIDLAAVSGTGDNGRIIRKDVENFTPSQVAQAAPVAAKATSGIALEPVAQAPVMAAPALPAGEEGSEEVKNSNMRKAIAKALANSKFNAPHFYLTIEVDMDNAKTSRVQINSLPDTKVSFNDMVLKACAMALRKHPQVNTSWNGATTRHNKHIHMGVAVAVDEGLVVPVVKFADQLGLTQIGASVKDLAGMFGIQEFTSIINQPNSAILSVGAIVEKPVVKNGEIVVGSTMKLTLACDHRTVDGAVGAQFLQTL
eukprot:maker-scaffold16_size723419-snap-gene-1.0 protein:Tk06617 transcript:maker-scaffold16_size723419-snap-gene-1.0-mRNA-1 annotation:"pyruvate dehydrogenase"